MSVQNPTPPQEEQVWHTTEIGHAGKLRVAVALRDGDAGPSEEESLRWRVAADSMRGDDLASQIARAFLRKIAG